MDGVPKSSLAYTLGIARTVGLAGHIISQCIQSRTKARGQYEIAEYGKSVFRSTRGDISIIFAQCFMHWTCS